jgi:glycerophosphoryl diester phosphodiesterase
VLVGSFSLRRMRHFRRLTGGRVPTSATPPEVVVFRLLPSARLARALTRGRVSALQVPHRRGRLRVVTPAVVRRAHRAGAHVHVWTVDDPAEMVELLDVGVDGLISDRTDLLREVLQQRHQWADQEGDRA